MKRVVALFLMLVALPVHAQGLNSRAGGLIKPSPSDRLSQVPADQYLTIVYPWLTVPAGTAAGWLVQQSTAAGYTITADTPFLQFTNASANRRVLVWEDGFFNFSAAHNATSDGEVTLATTIYGLDAVATTTNAWCQIAYGDSTNFIVNKKPHSGFGIIATGSTNASSGYANAANFTAYVSSGADTTYVPFATAATNFTVMKLWIHADPGGGPVTFWANDVLQATIASPVRLQDGMSTFGFWTNAATAGGSVVLGPVTIQRAWP